MMRVASALVFLFVLTSTNAQTKTDSLITLAKEALLQEDVYRAGYFIQAIQKAERKSLSEIEILQSLRLEKLVLEDSLQSALQYVEKCRRSHNETLRIHAQVMEGRILNKQYQFKKSIAVFEVAQKSIKQNHIVLSEELLHWLGNSFMETGDYALATKYIRAAIKLCQSDSARFFIKLAQARITSGLCYKKAANYEAAEQEYKLALVILENSPIAKFKERSRIYINLGNVYNDQWNYLPARENYLKSLQLNQNELRDSTQLTLLYNNLALFYQRYGNLVMSKEYYDKWFAMFNSQEEKFRNTAGVMLINYGAFLNSISEFDREHRVLQKASKYITNASGPDNRLRLVLAKAHNFENRYQPDSLQNQLDQARKIVVENPEVSVALKYSYYSAQSVQYTNAKRFHEADSLLILALQEAIIDGNNNTLSEVYRIMGLNFEVQSLHQRAVASFQMAIRAVAGIMPVYHPQRIALLNNIGASFLNNNMPDSAKHYLLLAIKDNQLPVKYETVQFSDPFEIVVSNFHLLKLAIQSKNQLKEAEKYLLAAFSIIEDKRRSFKSGEDQREYNKHVHEFFDVAIEYYHTMFSETGNEYYFIKSFEMKEKARYQSLQHSLRDVRIHEFAGVTQRILDSEKATQKKIDLLTSQLVEETVLGPEANTDLIEEYKRTLSLLNSKHKIMIDSVQHNLPGLYNLKFSSESATPEVLRKDLLRDEMALVQYHVGAEKIFVLIVTKHKYYSLLLGNKTELIKLIRRLSNINNFRLNNEYIQVSHEVYKKFVYPIDSMLQGNKKITRYLLIPDREINYVPFDALVTQPASKLAACKFLLNTKIISYGYSSTLLWQEFSGYTTDLKNVKMLAYAPTFVGESDLMLESNIGLRNAAARSQYANFSFQPLKMNVEEVKSISFATKKKGFRNETITDQSADESSFKSKNLNDFQIVHLATHGFVDYPTAYAAGIAFSFNDQSSEDGILFMDEIFSLRLHTHLVCLSACQTGFGQVDAGEGIISLTRAFLYAGAKNLVVSLWSVQDNSTALLMQKFYNQFAKTKSVSLSLRQAKLQMLKEGEFVHPYSWAGFIHVGFN